MNDELKAKLERFLPIAVVVRLEGGSVQGRVEHSFSMDWDAKRVNIFWSGKAYSILGEHQLDGPKNAKHNMNEYKVTEFLVDPLAEDSPIEVDWERWLADLAGQPGDKFAKRNAMFTIKPHGVYQLRAMAAERELAELKPRYKNVCTARDEADEQLEKLRAILNPQETEDEDHV